MIFPLRKSNSLVLLLILFLLSCETKNSNSFDDVLYGDGGQMIDTELSAAFAILKRDCMSCHNRHSEWANYTTSEDWVNAGLIFPGEPENSFLLHRIINTPVSEASGSIQNMPQGGSALDPDDYQALRDWISNI